jgi:hypothetical protein
LYSFWGNVLLELPCCRCPRLRGEEGRAGGGSVCYGPTPAFPLIFLVTSSLTSPHPHLPCPAYTSDHHIKRSRKTSHVKTPRRQPRTNRDNDCPPPQTTVKAMPLSLEARFNDIKQPVNSSLLYKPCFPPNSLRPFSPFTLPHMLFSQFLFFLGKNNGREI